MFACSVACADRRPPDAGKARDCMCAGSGACLCVPNPLGYRLVTFHNLAGNGRASQPLIPNAAHKMIYIRPNQRGPPVGHWPIPENYWLPKVVGKTLLFAWLPRICPGAQHHFYQGCRRRSPSVSTNARTGKRGIFVNLSRLSADKLTFQDQGSFGS